MSNVPKKRVASSAFGNKWLLFQSYREKILTGKQGKAQLILLFRDGNPTSKAEQHLTPSSSHSLNTLIIKSRTILALSTAENVHCHFISLLKGKPANQKKEMLIPPGPRQMTSKTNPTSNKHATLRQLLTQKH